METDLDILLRVAGSKLGLVLSREDVHTLILEGKRAGFAAALGAVTEAEQEEPPASPQTIHAYERAKLTPYERVRLKVEQRRDELR